MIQFHTSTYFDRPAVKNATDRAANQVLRRFGAMTRTTARRSMRYRTDEVKQKKEQREGKRKRITKASFSSPGEPPRAVKPHPWIRRFLEYRYDRARKSVIIGAAKFSRSSGAPRLHEHGGKMRVRNPSRRIRKIGDGGEIRLAGDEVRYTRLETQAQVDRANRLNEQLYGPEEITADYKPRPFMGPAFAKTSTNLDSLWRDSVKR